MDIVTDLWEAWKEHYATLHIDPNRICKDGIGETAIWENQARKILFILKEADNWEEGDIRILLRGNPKYQVFHTIGRWAAGILLDFPDFAQVDKVSVMSESLKKIAMINLKKTSGLASSDMGMISAYASRDRVLLRRQIQEIKPTIVVGCGVFDYLVWLFDLPVDPDSPYGRCVYCREQDFWVIPGRHPNRANNLETYQNLKAHFEAISRLCG